MLFDERVDLGDEAGAAEREVGVDAILERGEAQLFELGDRALGERLVGEVGERRATPQRFSFVQELRALFGFGCARPFEQPLEALGVDVSGVQSIRVADGFDSGGPERPAQLRHEALQRRRCGRGRLLAPEIVDKTVRGDGFAGVQDQQRQQRAPAAGWDARAPRPVEDLHRAQDPELHLAPEADGSTQALASR